MEASPDCKKEQKQCESEAEDSQEGHQAGSLNEKALPGKAANRKTVFIPASGYICGHSDLHAMPPTLNHKMVFLGPRNWTAMAPPLLPKLIPNGPESGPILRAGFRTRFWGRIPAHYMDY